MATVDPVTANGDGVVLEAVAAHVERLREELARIMRAQRLPQPVRARVRVPMDGVTEGCTAQFAYRAVTVRNDTDSDLWAATSQGLAILASLRGAPDAGAFLIPARSEVTEPVQGRQLALFGPNTGTPLVIPVYLWPEVLPPRLAQTRGPGQTTIALGANTPLGTTFLDANSVTSAAALASIAAPVVSPASGIYDVEAVWTVTGTAETKPLNLQFLNFGGSPTVSIPSSPGSYRMTFPAVPGTGGGFLIRAATAATGGAIYTATLAATRIA